MSAALCQSHFANVGANRIHYVTAGRGENTLVFVHGWACQLDFWREQVAALAEKARLIFIDLPGHGLSDKPQIIYTLDFFAEAVLAVLRDAKIAKAIFVGHSMGGAVISRIAHHAPEKITALVSVDGLLGRPPLLSAESQLLIRQLASRHYLAHAKKIIAGFFPVSGSEVLRDHLMAEMLATPQHVMLGGMIAMFGPDQPDWILSSVDVPVIVINSKSLWWDAHYENHIRTLSTRSDYTTLDGAGHFLMLEQPSIFNGILTERLQKHGLIAK
jgi:pimeloyl-ACP methyl ester carboxylesterase